MAELHYNVPLPNQHTSSSGIVDSSPPGLKNRQTTVAAANVDALS